MLYALTTKWGARLTSISSDKAEHVLDGPHGAVRDRAARVDRPAAHDRAVARHGAAHGFDVNATAAGRGRRVLPRPRDRLVGAVGRARGGVPDGDVQGRRRAQHPARRQLLQDVVARRLDDERSSRRAASRSRCCCSSPTRTRSRTRSRTTSTRSTAAGHKSDRGARSVRRCRARRQVQGDQGRRVVLVRGTGDKEKSQTIEVDTDIEKARKATEQAAQLRSRGQHGPAQARARQAQGVRDDGPRRDQQSRLGAARAQGRRPRAPHDGVQEAARRSQLRGQGSRPRSISRRTCPTTRRS